MNEEKNQLVHIYSISSNTQQVEFSDIKSFYYLENETKCLKLLNNQEKLSPSIHAVTIATK